MLSPNVIHPLIDHGATPPRSTRPQSITRFLLVLFPHTHRTLAPRLFSDGGSGNVTGTAAAGTGDTSPEQTPATSLIDGGASLKPTNYQALTTAASANPRGDSSNGDRGHSGDSTSREPNGAGNADQVDGLPAVGGPPWTTEEAQGHDEQETPGVFGRNGLLATPHVKALLVLGCTVQVGVPLRVTSFAASLWAPAVMLVSVDTAQ